MNTNRSFTPVLYGRKRKVRNHWQRGDIFYARIKIPYPGEETPKVRCIPLKAKTIPSAVKELLELQVKRDKGKTVVRGNTPTLAEYSEKYIDRLYEGNRKQLKTGPRENSNYVFGPANWVRTACTRLPWFESRGRLISGQGRVVQPEL